MYSRSTSAVLSLLLCEAWIGSSVNWQSSVGWRQKTSLSSANISRSSLPVSLNSTPPFLFFFLSAFSSLWGFLFSAPHTFSHCNSFNLSLFYSLTFHYNIRHKEAQPDRVFLAVTASTCHIRSLLIGVTRCQGTGKSHSTVEDVTEICLPHSRKESLHRKTMQWAVT